MTARPITHHPAAVQALIQRYCDVVVKGGNLVVQGDRLASQVNCLLVAADLVGNDAEQMHTVGVIGIDCEYFSVPDLRFIKLTRAMMAQRGSGL